MSKLIQARVKNARAKTFGNEKLILQQIIQEISLLGLWRSKFFENASFYGGTCLRLLYGLNRYSEYLDFTLLKPNNSFDPSGYVTAVEKELSSFGFSVSVEIKQKKVLTPVLSAFIKADTQVCFIVADSKFTSQKGSLIKVKLVVDVDAVTGFDTEIKQVFWPQPHSILACDLPSLMAGKLHATFCRGLRRNVKGRDWFDFFWYLGQGVKPNWNYLGAKMKQSGHWGDGQDFSVNKFKSWALSQVENLDVSAAKRDVERFIEDRSQVDSWDLDLFKAAIRSLND